MLSCRPGLCEGYGSRTTLTRDAFQLVELARLLDASSFKTRKEGLDHVRRMKSSAKGNDPSHLDAIRVHEGVARLSIEYAVRKSEAVLGLVRSWE